MKQRTEYDNTATSNKQPRKSTTTMGKVDTSDLIMIMVWITDTSSRSHKLE